MVINLKECRVNYGITQKRLSELTGISTVSISNYEAGKQYPNIKTALLIAFILECSVEDLYQVVDNNYG